MKAVVLLCLVAAASAQFFTTYNRGFTHYPYHFYKPAVYSSYSAGGVQNTVGLHKREADPLMYYSSHYPTTYGYYPYAASHVYNPVMYYNKPVVHSKTGVKADDSVTPFGYASKGMYYANSAGTVHKAKREADPYMVYSHAYPSVYSHAYMPYSYSHVVKPYHYKTYSNDFVSGKQYAAKGQYHAVTAGSEHIAKREAEPYYYNSHFSGYTYPYTTSHFGYTYPTTAYYY